MRPKLHVSLSLLLVCCLLPVRPAGFDTAPDPCQAHFVEGGPDWLAAPQRPEDLMTEVPYVYLTGALIRTGALLVPECPAGGLGVGGLPTPCGVEAGFSQVFAWQNRFDPYILAASRESGVPARFLKRLIARESQFWPGAIRQEEVGLGHVTWAGAESALLWNSVLADDVCKQLGRSPCRERLTGELFTLLSADCPECSYDISLPRAQASLPFLAGVVYGYCRQAVFLIRQTASAPTPLLLEPATLWRLVAFSYSAGPGCLAQTFTRAFAAGEEREVGWEEFQAAVPPVCERGLPYALELTR